VADEKHGTHRAGGGRGGSSQGPGEKTHPASGGERAEGSAAAAGNRPATSGAPSQPDQGRDQVAPGPAAGAGADPDRGASDVGEVEVGGGRNFVADAVRKAFLAGVGALFLTEEGARKLAREWKLPKELIGYVVGQATGAKDEVMRILSVEVRRFFESEALRREFLKVLTSMSVEVKAEIRLKQTDDDRLKPVVKAGVKPKVRRPEREEAEGGPDGELE
jgi:hypothetical protein